MSFTPWENPMGTAGFEFIEYAAPDPVAMGKLFEKMGFSAIAKHRHKNVTLYRQGGINFIINAEADSFAQRFARLHGPSICAIAFRVQDAALAYQRAGTGRVGLRHPQRPDGAEHPGDQGHRRFADLPGGPLDRQERRQRRRHRQHQYLRRRLRAHSRRQPEPHRARPDLHRPPDAQRLPWPHEGVGRVLRTLLQLPRDPLFRYRGPGHRREEQGHDKPVRQHPHSHQRGRDGEGRPDPGIPGHVPRRGHPAHRAGLDRPAPDGGRCAATASSCWTPSTRTTSWSTSGSPAMARTWRS